MPQDTLAAMIDALLDEDPARAEELREMLLDQSATPEPGLSGDPEAAKRVTGYAQEFVQKRMAKKTKEADRP